MIAAKSSGVRPKDDAVSMSFSDPLCIAPRQGAEQCFTENIGTEMVRLEDEDKSQIGGQAPEATSSAGPSRAA